MALQVVDARFMLTLQVHETAIKVDEIIVIHPLDLKPAAAFNCQVIHAPYP
jgi:hypothetical protein